MKQLHRLFNEINITAIDTLEQQWREYREILNPQNIFKEEKKGKLTRFCPKAYKGMWIFYPWNKTIVRCLRQNDYQNLRLSRNRNLILPSEQKKMSKLRIGIAGLNVGASGALCLAHEGIGNFFKLADMDKLSVSNLNRFRAGLCDLEINKVYLTARQMYEINPFLRINLFPNGLNVHSLRNFLLKPKLDILIEETDNLNLKIRIREQARATRVPVIMVTGNEADVIVDVERYDLDPQLPILNGYLKIAMVQRLTKNYSTGEKIKLSRDFIGAEFLNPRLKKSFREIGKTLAGIPQLAETSFLRGAILCYLVRNIFTNAKINSGRYQVRLGDSLKLPQ